MKKIVLYMFFVLGLFLVGCDDPVIIPEEKLITHEEVVSLYNDTIDKYLVSQSVGLYMVVESDSKKAEVTFNYNLNGFKISSLEYVSKSSNGNYSSYIKDSIEYVNYDGTKTQNTLSSSVESSLITQYSFINITKDFFGIFNESILNSLVVKSDKDGVVKLEWDKSKYVLNLEGLTVEEKEKATLKFNGIKDNTSSIEVNMVYNDKEILKIDSIWKKTDGKEQKLLLEFKGLDNVTINYPSDLSSYENRGK